MPISPCPVSVKGGRADALDQGGHAIAWGKEAPTATGIGGQLVSVPGPGAGLAAGDDVAIAAYRRGWRGAERRLLDRRRDEHVEQLQRFVVE